MDKPVFSVGYAKGIITPPRHLHIPGHGFVPRPSEGVWDDVYAYALAFAYGEEKGILFNCDALGIYSAGGKAMREMIAERCSIPVEAVYIACTHCHTAMFLGGSLTEKEPGGSYNARMRTLFCDLAEEAFEDLKPATIHIARGEVLGVGFIRRFKMKDGTIRTNPPRTDPNLGVPDGIQDESLQLVRFVREEGKEIVLVNFGTHPDVVGGNRYTPDWPGYVVEVMKGALQNKAEVVMLNGFGGDSNQVNRYIPKPKKKAYDFAWEMARKISGEALKIYDKAMEIPAGHVLGYEDVASIEINPYEEWEVPISKQICACKALTEADLPEELRAYKISLKKARRIVDNLKQEGDFKIPGYALQVGNLCFVGFPGEPFSETGINIKNASKMDMTITTCRTNGSEGYFPTPRAYSGGGYERDYTRFGPNCAPELEAAAKRMTDKMEKSSFPEGEE